MARDHRRLAAIVWADAVGYSLLMGRDEGATLAGLTAYRRELSDPMMPNTAAVVPGRFKWTRQNPGPKTEKT